ncbi:MAG TPA: response regulator [Syntrophorhabdaceae bacterium]
MIDNREFICEQQETLSGGQLVDCLNVLLVDDSEPILAVLKEFLDFSGYHVITVDSGSKALETVSRGGIDCVISDYHMPDMDGLELLKIMRALGCSVPFFLMTGSAPEELEDKLDGIGIDGFIPKPVDFSEMLGCISRVTGARQTA